VSTASDPTAWHLPTRLSLEADDDLTLRRLQERDLEGLLALGSDEEYQRWTAMPVPFTATDAQAYLQAADRRWDEGRAVTLAIEHQQRFAGSVDLYHQPGRKGEGGGWADLGFGLLPHARGHAVMTRSVRTLLAWAFEALALEGVHWSAYVGNDDSRRVALACGFTLEATVRGLLLQRGRRRDGWMASLLPCELLT